MAVYSSGNMDRMRMEAVRRSQEMHRRSSEEDAVPLQNEERSDNSSDKSNTSAVSDIRSLLNGKSDSDVLLTAALIWLLYKEGGDIKLLLALAYILL